MKKFVSLMMAFILLLGMTQAVFASSPSEMPTYEAGANGKLSWKLQDSTLIISGKDAMTDFCVYAADDDRDAPEYMVLTSAPWSKHRKTVKTVVLEEGVTSIGWYAFNCFSALETVYVTKSLEHIYENAFRECGKLKNIYFSQSKKGDTWRLYIDNEQGGNDAFNDAEWTFSTSYISNSITYELNGGKNNSANPTQYKSGKAVTLKAPTRTGYTFGGWYTDKSLKNKITTIPATAKKNYVLYAKWTANKYTVAFSANGGKGTMKSLSMSYGTAKNLTENSFTREGYTFTGWNTKKDGTGTAYKNKASVKNLTSVSGKKITLYAQWKKTVYHVVYDGNGASSGKVSEQRNVKYGEKLTLRANAFQRSLYTFTAWNTKKDGKGTSYAAKKTVTNLRKTDGTVTLYAQWKLQKNCYTITYSLGGGTNSAKNPEAYSKSKAVTLQKPTRTGYTFAGWYSDSKLTKKVTSIPKGSTGNKKLYAKWTANKYTVAFSANGGKGTMKSLSMSYGTAKNLTVNSFTRSGYSFTEWNTKKDGTGKSYKNKASVKNLTSVSGKKITLYAQWKTNLNDQKELAECEKILRRTGEPAYSWHQNKKVSHSYKNTTGERLWSCRQTPNGALEYIFAYDKNKELAATYCRWNEPYLTMTTTASLPNDYRTQIINGTYDFTNDPAKVKIVWYAYDDNTTKTEIEKRMNCKISEEVYTKVMNKYNFLTTMQRGNSCVIVYGRNSKGKLVAKYAGSAYYNYYSNGLVYNFIGVNPENTEQYGKAVNGELLYAD